jgi:hypothetical protein
MTQARCHWPARELIARRKAGGDYGLEAVRVLKRWLSDVICQALLIDLNSRHPAGIQPPLDRGDSHANPGYQRDPQQAISDRE